MTPLNHARSLTTLATLCFALAACGPNDAAIKTAVDQAISGTQGVTADVSKGVVTLAGEFPDSTSKASTETTVKGVKGVKSVVDNATVKPPAPPPVVLSPDDSLKANVTTALKDYPKLSADVKDGVVTLTGEVQRADLTKVMQALNALHPKKVENKATVKK